MKTGKKLASTLSVALAACMLLSACQGGGGTASSGTASAGGTASASASSAAPQKMTDIQSMKATDPSKLPAAASARKDTLVIGCANMSGKFQQLYAESVDDYHVSYAVSGATLLNNDDEGNLTDGTASMTVSPDGLTFTFKLKYNDKYSDGTPVKAADYINYYKVLCDKTYDGAGNPLMSYNVVGAQDYHDGKAASITGITAPDDKTIQVKLSQVNTSAQYALGGAYPISTAKYGSLIKQGDLKAFKALSMVNYVTDGPYTLTSYKEGQNATMKANPNYCEGAPKIPNIIIKVVAEGAEMQSVTTGDVDIDEEVTCNADQVAIGQAAKFVNMQIQPTLGYGWVGMNHKNPLFADTKVRQALLYGLDRAGIVKAVYGNYAHVQNINQTAESWLYTTEGINNYDYDLNKAAELLKEAGWTKDGSGKLMKDGKEFKFAFTATKGNSVTDVLIPSMVNSYKKLGITVSAEYVDWPTLQTKFSDKKYDMAFMAWGLTPDPDDSYTYSTSGSENYLNYSNTDLDNAYKTALSTQDKTARKAAYQKVYQIINADLPNFMIYQRSDLIAYNTRLKTLKVSPYVPIYQTYNTVELQ